MKRVFVIAVVLAVLLCWLSPAAAQEAEGVGATDARQVELTLGSTKAVVNGDEVTLDVPPRVVDGTTLMPLRFVCDDVLGASVGWDEEEKKVVVNKEGRVVELWIGKRDALVDGKGYSMLQAPMVEKGRTLLPLRFLTENFGLKTVYHPSSKKIVITQTEPEISEPVADFEFTKDSIRAGEGLRVIDRSYDPDGGIIMDRLWEIERESGDKKQVSDLSDYFPVRSPGKYIIRLRVMDGQGIWSQWFQRVLDVRPNQPPVITSLSANPSRAAQGEEIEFFYDYIDEEFDSIQEERWVYRYREHSGQIRELVGKPRALFGARSYEVGLKLRDSFNNWSKEAVVTVDMTSDKKMSELEYRFSKPIPGDIILNPDALNFNNFPNADWEVEHGGPTLIMSNSPETVNSTGVLYEDTAEGPVRLFYHHVNNTGENKELALWVKNRGNRPVRLTLERAGTGGPSKDEMFMGQRVVSTYFESSENRVLEIAPGKTISLGNILGLRAMKPREMLSGMVDMECSGPLTFTVAMIEEGQTYLTPLPVLPSDGIHVRGTFENSDVLINIAQDGEQSEKMILGRGMDKDHFLQGYDALGRREVVNHGNYGVVYKTEFVSDTPTGILVNPRGSGFRGAISGLDGESYVVPDKGVLNFYGAAAVVGVSPEGKISRFVYTPAGGSDTPVIFAFIPKGEW